MVGQALTSWLTSAGKLAKTLVIRLVFITSLIILLPLAVLNRQTVTLSLNPMDLMRAAPESALTMPLFIALFVAFCLGLLLGWLLGYVGQNTRRRALWDASLPAVTGVIKPTQSVGSDKAKSVRASAFETTHALPDGASMAQGTEGDIKDETRKSDESNVV